MPRKEIYWKNPEEHRREFRERQKKLVRLGYTGGLRNYDTYVRELERRKHVAKSDPKVRKARAEASRRYTKRLTELGFGKTGLGFLKYKIWKESQQLNGRNRRATPEEILSEERKQERKSVSASRGARPDSSPANSHPRKSNHFLRRESRAKRGKRRKRIRGR